MKTLTIQRKKWLRGKPEDSALLRRSDGRMCCLGFYSLKVGATRGEICEKADPQDLLGSITTERAAELRSKFSGLARRNGQHLNTKICNRLMVINDDAVMEDAQREGKLKKLFARIGWRVRFVS